MPEQYEHKYEFFDIVKNKIFPVYAKSFDEALDHFSEEDLKAYDRGDIILNPTVFNPPYVYP
jgi:hypothetical protein